MDGGQQRWTSHLGPINITFYSSSLVGIQPLCSSASASLLEAATRSNFAKSFNYSAAVTARIPFSSSFDSHLPFQILLPNTTTLLASPKINGKDDDEWL